jgi:hypothetical protein
MIKFIKVLFIVILIVYTVTCHLNTIKTDEYVNNSNSNSHSNSHYSNSNRYNHNFDDDFDEIYATSSSSSQEMLLNIFKQYLDLFGQKLGRKIAGWVKKNANFRTLPTDEDLYNDDRVFEVEYDEDINQIPKTLEWGGIKVSDPERSALVYVKIMREKLRRSSSYEYGSSSSWLFIAGDKELLRFVRGQISHKEDAWNAILAHAKWRNSKYGADKVSDFPDNFMHYEIFWLGVNKQGCPTMVVRTVAHDGSNYNEDPELFTAFFTSVLEKGRHLYGVATDKQVCMILDRFPFDHPGGVTKKEDERLDFAVIKNLLNLFQHLYTTLITHYPEILDHARVMPASWVFKACYKITSRVMDKNNRKKFRMVSHEDVNKEMASLFRADVLPEHFGGTAQLFGGLPASKAAKEAWNNAAPESSSSNINSNNNNNSVHNYMLRGSFDNAQLNHMGEISVVEEITFSDSDMIHPSFNSEFYPAI